jgi:hypothetical protein
MRDAVVERNLPIESAKLADGLKTVAKFAWSHARDQMKRRGAELTLQLDALTLDRELSEAIEVLRGDSSSIATFASVWARAKLSGRPDEFDQEHVREWLRHDEVEALLKRAAVNFIADKDVDEARSAAERLYAASSGDKDWYGGRLFDVAIVFLVTTIDSKVSTGDRALMDLVRTRSDGIEDSLETLRGHVGGLDQKFDEFLAGQAEFPIEVVEQHIRRTLREESRARAIADPLRTARVLALAEQVRTGDLSKAPAAVRAELFRFAAATLARSDRGEEAGSWLEAAKAAGASDLVSDEARVLLLSGDPAGAIALLRDRDDPESLGLLLEALVARDGRTAAIAYFEAHVPPDDLGGYAIASVATWIALEGDTEKAEGLLAAITPVQVEDNPTLLLTRARFRLTQMAPAGFRAALIETGGFPKPNFMRDDAEGRRLREAALEDLTALQSFAQSLRNPDFDETIETHRLFLQLTSADPRIEAEARETLMRSLADPATAVSSAWLALHFDLDFDQTILRSRLDQARTLAGWTDTELAVAAQLVMLSDNSEEILAFVEEHRDRLAQVLVPEIGIGLEIEVLARVGRLDDARARLAAVRDRIAPDLANLLAGIIEEEAGADGVAVRLAAFEESGTERDLGLLAAALARKRDARAGDYTARLWRMRYRIDDAVNACTHFFNADQDRELGAFLDEIGSLVDEHPRLREFRAWHSYLQGRLAEAQASVEILRAAEPDRVSLRQLAINIALEAGEWHRLGALAQQDLERAGERSAAQLHQGALLAHAAANPAADELLRAAVAKAPDDPNMLVAAYSLAVRRGRDWSPEASGWLRRAIELSGERGPLQPIELKDLIRL